MTWHQAAPAQAAALPGQGPTPLIDPADRDWMRRVAGLKITTLKDEFYTNHFLVCHLLSNALHEKWRFFPLRNSWYFVL
jgi:hypothetical protein